MPVHGGKSTLVKDVFPLLSEELVQLLRDAGEADLASQVSGLSIVDRCRCGDDFCGSFYTQPKPKGAYGPGHRNIGLPPAKGMLILDIVDGVIANVEVLYRNDIREKLLAILP
jgi:hypothetical protein